MTGVELFSARGWGAPRIPALAVTGDAVLAVAVRRFSRSDRGPSDLVARSSGDAGTTWGPLRVLERGWGRTIDNPTLVVDAGGRIHLLSQRGYRRLRHRVSDDGGLTFGPQRDLTGILGAARGMPFELSRVAPGPGTGARLASGRLVVPAWVSPSRGRRLSPASTIALLSDDDGMTWRVGGVAAGPGGVVRNPTEATATALPDGGVLLGVRQRSRPARAFTRSDDGGETWSPPWFADELVDPVCHAGLATSGHDVVFVGPDGRDAEPLVGGTRVRERLTLHRSADGGRTWGAGRVLDPGPSGYAVIATGGDGTLHVLAERGKLRGTQHWPVALDYRRLAPAELPG